MGDLLDSSAIESGVLRLQRHWCDLTLVVEAARRLVRGGDAIRVRAVYVDNQETKWEATSWYAPRVGLVKFESGYVTKELKSFTAGK